MKKINNPTIYHLDAKGKPIGRLASDIAILIQGKKLATYSPEKLPNVLVTIQNIDQIIFTGKKLKNKLYYKYSGYPGGIKVKRLEEIIETNPTKFFLDVVRHMLPKNKLSNKLIKRIQFKK